MRALVLLLGLALLLAAGCGFSAGTSQPADPDAPAPSLDTDRDTIPDADDNCPTIANMNQRDHDGDHLGDACDLCPHLATAGDPDSDGDGIGDSCDPRNGTDTLLAFEGFYDDSTVLTSWAQANGTWQLADGKLRQTAASTWAFIGPAAPISRLYADYAFTALSVGPAIIVPSPQGPTAIQPSVGNFAGVSAIPQRNYGCAIAKDPTNRVTAWAASGNTQQNTPKSWNGDLAPGGTYRIVENMTSQNRCEFSQGAITANDSENLGSATNGTFALSVAASTVEFDYVFLVAIGP